jgi:methyltransferase (TIGR00027 family)
VGRFTDPTALHLLPPADRARVESFRAGTAPTGVRERWKRVHLAGLSKMMVARTVAIDEALRAAASPQVVILGAGLDGRAWRMSELRDRVVFEVDHPDSQRTKRERSQGLTPMAQDIRFVPVDFERDRLDDALAAAGHNRARATTWIWEGVVMYLTPADVEATLAVIARRSSPGSRLIVAYHSPALMLRLAKLFKPWPAEPLRSTFTPEAMRALLGRHGFDVERDDDICAIGATLSAESGRATRLARHLRIVTADHRRS